MDGYLASPSATKPATTTTNSNYFKTNSLVKLNLDSMDIKKKQNGDKQEKNNETKSNAMTNNATTTTSFNDDDLPNLVVEIVRPSANCSSIDLSVEDDDLDLENEKENRCAVDTSVRRTGKLQLDDDG
jgi:hypothetical protein